MVKKEPVTSPSEDRLEPRRTARRDSHAATEIREAAARVFLRKGFAGSTIADIAAELGRPKGSIHYHIDSKQDLLFEILTASLDDLDRSVRKVADYPLSALDRLRLVLREHVQHVVGQANAYTATASERELAALKPEHLAEVSQRRRDYRVLVYALIEEAQADGAIQVENVTIAARAILSIVVQLPRWFSEDGQLSSDAMADALWRLVLHGLSGPKPQGGESPAGP